MKPCKRDRKEESYKRELREKEDKRKFGKIFDERFQEKSRQKRKRSIGKRMNYLQNREKKEGEKDRELAWQKEGIKDKKGEKKREKVLGKRKKMSWQQKRVRKR